MSAFGGKVDTRIWLPNNHSIQMVSQSATCEQLGGLSKEDLLYAQFWCQGAENAGSPTNVKRTVALPLRKPNATYRSRDLTEREVERLVEAAKDNRWGHRAPPWFCWPSGTVCGPPSWRTCAGAGGPGKRHPARP